MPRPKRKTEKVEVFMTYEQKQRLQFLAGVNKKTMSEYLLDAFLSAGNGSDDSAGEQDSLLQNHLQAVKAFQIEQQRTMYVILQFSMYIASFSKSQDLVMKFYESVYQDALAAFGGEDNGHGQ